MKRFSLLLPLLLLTACAGVEEWSFRHYRIDHPEYHRADQHSGSVAGMRPTTLTNFLPNERQECFYLLGWVPTPCDDWASWITLGEGEGFPDDLMDRVQDGCALFGGFRLQHISADVARLHVVFPARVRETFELCVNGKLVGTTLDGSTPIRSLGETHWAASWNVPYDFEAENVVGIHWWEQLQKCYVLRPSFFGVYGGDCSHDG